MLIPQKLTSLELHFNLYQGLYAQGKSREKGSFSSVRESQEKFFIVRGRIFLLSINILYNIFYILYILKLPWLILTKCHVSALFMFGGSDKRLAGRYKPRPGVLKLGRVLKDSAECYKTRLVVKRLGRVLKDSAGCYKARQGVTRIGRFLLRVRPKKRLVNRAKSILVLRLFAFS